MNDLKIGVLLAGLSLLACSARYEVGGLEEEALGSSGSGGSGGSSSARGGQSSGGSGPTTAGPGAQSCAPPGGMPPTLSGDFVAPQAVWARLAPFIWGEEPAAPPSELPATTTYAWAGEVVDEAFAQQEDDGVTPGGGWFVRRWLGLAQGTPLEGDYEQSLLREDLNALEALLLSTWAPGHSGVFSEKPWLATHQSIPRRGTSIARLLFGMPIPAPPAGVSQELDSTLPDREAIEGATLITPSCGSCHVVINGLGYALGNFDAFGDYRTLDHGLPIDTSGRFMTATRTFEYDGIVDLGTQAADSCEGARGLVRSFLIVALREQGYDEEHLYENVDAHTERVTQAFFAGGRSYRALLRAYAQSGLVLY